MYKYEAKPWWTQGGRNLDELINLELNAAVRDRHRPAKTKFNQSSNMQRVMRMDYFQVEHELDGAKPLVNLHGPRLEVPEQPLPSKKPVRKYPPPRVVDIEEGSSEISYPSDVPRSKCAVRPYFYGNVPGRMFH